MLEGLVSILGYLLLFGGIFLIVKPSLISNTHQGKLQILGAFVMTAGPIVWWVSNEVWGYV